MISSWFIQSGLQKKAAEKTESSDSSNADPPLPTAESEASADVVPTQNMAPIQTSASPSLVQQHTRHASAKTLPAIVAASPPQAVHHHTLPSLRLTPVQSCQIHGWLNPRRTLHWDDVVGNNHMTLSSLIQNGLTAADLKTLQPDVRMWIKHKNVGLRDVPSMVEWPLHPVQHLRANLGDLATAHYQPALMLRLGITYEYLRQGMRMDDDWMRVLRYKPNEWAEIGFGRDQAVAMGRRRVEWVFEPMDFDSLVMLVSSVPQPPSCAGFDYAK